MKKIQKFLFILLASTFFAGCSDFIDEALVQDMADALPTENGQEISEKDIDQRIKDLEKEIALLKLIQSKNVTTPRNPEISQKSSHQKQEKKSEETLYKIDYVYDGDTYAVWIDGKKEKIRVLGIDTPEKDGGFRPEGCYGDHASIYAKKKLAGKKVSLLKPKTHESRDKYGRMLRYVFLDGKDFGAHLIEEGYAFSYKRFPHPRLKYYNQLEKQAQKNKKGMWNPDNCDYWGQTNLID